MTVPMKAITTVAGRTAVGRVRDRNEDALLVGYRVFAVADGMGGHRAGDVAAATAIASVTALDETAADGLPAARQQLRNTVQTAHRQVVAAGTHEADGRGMGTTLTTARVDASQLLVAHVGDSRAYLWHDGSLRQLTDDHTRVRELVDRGLLDQSQADDHPRQHLLTRSVGRSHALQIDLIEAPVSTGDVLLLCTDGLTGPVDDATIAGVLHAEPHAAAVADRLIHLALLAGGPDNVTVVAVNF